MSGRRTATYRAASDTWDVTLPDGRVYIVHGLNWRGDGTVRRIVSVGAWDGDPSGWFRPWRTPRPVSANGVTGRQVLAIIEARSAAL